MRRSSLRLFPESQSPHLLLWLTRTTLGLLFQIVIASTIAKKFSARASNHLKYRSGLDSAKFIFRGLPLVQDFHRLILLV